MIATFTLPSGTQAMPTGPCTQVIITSELAAAQGLARERRTIMRIEHRALLARLAGLDKHTREYWAVRRDADAIEARLRKDRRKYRRLMSA